MRKTACLILLIFTLSGCNQNEVFSKNMMYMDTYINVKIYSNDEKNVKKAFEEIDALYKEYDILADRYDSYEGIININYINERLYLNEEIQIDSKLYNLLNYSQSYASSTNDLFNIALGNVIDVWSQYRDGIKEGTPSLSELQKSGSINCVSLVLRDNNVVMKTSDIKLDLGGIAKGYVTELAGDYLKSVGLNKYLITAGTSSVKAGDHYNKGKYKIGLTNPNKLDELYKIINGNNITITTSGSYERYYEYQGIKYNHIINPTTLFPSNYVSSVTVINDDAAIGEILSTTLFLMPIEEGLQFIKQFQNVEAIWYGINDEITTTDGIKKYE